MEKYKNYIILFVIIIGLGLGYFIGLGPKDSNNPTINSALTVEDPDINSQATVLIVGVNDIHEATTELESLWIAKTSEVSSTIELSPIYPTSENNALQAPHSPILVTSAAPNEVFELGFVNSDEIDHIIILDKVAFWTLIQLSDQQTSIPVDINEGTLFDDYPKVWDEPIEALDNQRGIISYLCSHKSPFSEAERIEQLVNLINKNIFTDLSIDELLSYWQLMNEIEFNFSCEIK